MPDTNNLLLFVGAGLLLNITPGPDVLYIVGRSLSQGRLAGVVSALGIGAGCLFHIAAAAFGLSALMLALPLQFLLLGSIFVINGTVVCLAYAPAASWLGGWLSARYDVSTWLNRTMGGLFIALGLRLALGDRR